MSSNTVRAEAPEARRPRARRAAIAVFMIIS
jgi:hypothetical protein